MSLVDLLILKLGARFTKLLIESWLGKGARSTVAGDAVDVLSGRIQSVADRKKAERELDELGDRMARELLPLFENAEKQGHVNADAVVLALESTLSGLMGTPYLIQKDLDPGSILTETRKTRPLPAAQFSQAETDLYDRALERSVRNLVEVASRLPHFEEAIAARSLQQLSNLTGNVGEVLERVGRIEATVGTKTQDERAREYEIDYRLAVQRNLDYLEIFGIDLPPESRSQKLSVAYISLNLESRSGGSSQSLPAEALFDRLKSESGRLLIRGDAGTGKSTLLRWAAMKAATGPHYAVEHYLPKSRFLAMDVNVMVEVFSDIASWRTRVPFLIRLRQCKAGSLPGPEEFPEMVAQALGGPPANWVKSVFQEGRALLLLDGVDEIPNAHRDVTRRAITDLVNQYPETYLVISTRPRAVEPDWLAHLGFQEARINPLSELDRANFIDRWHEAVAEELKTRGKTSSELPGLAESLKRQLEDVPEVRRLAANPLLCAMICALHRDRREKLPERQRQLCEDLCQALLHRRERESGLNLDEFPEPYRRLDYPQKRAAVQELAHHMVLNEYSSVSTKEAEEQIGKALKQFPGHSAGDAPVVTDSLVERSGILREESPGEISFIHNAFKELLAGDYFAGADAAGLLARHALDPAWQPVVLFAVAADLRGVATKVIRKVLEPGSAPSAELRARQLMALRCRAAALYVEEELDHQLQQLTESLFPPRNMEDAEALATAGNTAVPFLTANNRMEDNEAAASIRALRLIGTSQARQALRGFLGDRRETVISELAQAVNPLEIEWVREQVFAGEYLPEGIAAQVRDLSPLSGFTNLKVLKLSWTQVADISPLATLTNLWSLSL
ncbi:MAG TPA: NACHT domain-containing protein, partial [Thermoanaerobaculia bacterium]|nr:NACHT domain-containing protein [Thermoanaerobaculia bacterium]